jgi:hypothetical protein
MPPRRRLALHWPSTIRLALLPWTHTFKGNLINQLRGQFSPQNSAITAPDEPPVTGLIVSGLAGFGRTFGAPYQVYQDRYQFGTVLLLSPVSTV